MWRRFCFLLHLLLLLHRNRALRDIIITLNVDEPTFAVFGSLEYVGGKVMARVRTIEVNGKEALNGEERKLMFESAGHRVFVFVVLNRTKYAGRRDLTIRFAPVPIKPDCNIALEDIFNELFWVHECQKKSEKEAPEPEKISLNPWEPYVELLKRDKWSKALLDVSSYLVSAFCEGWWGKRRKGVLEHVKDESKLLKKLWFEADFEVREQLMCPPELSGRFAKNPMDFVKTVQKNVEEIMSKKIRVAQVCVSNGIQAKKKKQEKEKEKGIKLLPLKDNRDVKGFLIIPIGEEKETGIKLERPSASEIAGMTNNDVKFVVMEAKLPFVICVLPPLKEALLHPPPPPPPA